jgi:hypothetical protein
MLVNTDENLHPQAAITLREHGHVPSRFGISGYVAHLIRQSLMSVVFTS